MKLIVTSPDFENESWIPERNSGHGADISPQLNVEGIDERAVSMVVTLDDLSHPIQPGYNHWVAWNLPPVGTVPGNLPKGAVAEQPIHIEQGLAYGKHCYRGPKPPFNWKHDYLFTIYILDTMLSISSDSGKNDVLRAIKGHILQSGTLVGSYQRRRK